MKAGVAIGFISTVDVVGKEEHTSPEIETASIKFPTVGSGVPLLTDTNRIV